MFSKMLRSIALVLTLISGMAYSHAQEPGEQTVSEQAKMEAEFSAMLKGATLKGTWAAVGPAGLGEDNKDGYQVVEAKKVKGDKWVLVSRFNYKGQQLDIPVPVDVKFAGDTAVMILNNLPTGDGATWSARILFHEDVYAGSWWESTKKKGGILSGIVSRETEEKDTEKEKASLPAE